MVRLQRLPVGPAGAVGQLSAVGVNFGQEVQDELEGSLEPQQGFGGPAGGGVLAFVRKTKLRKLPKEGARKFSRPSQIN